MLFLCDQQQLIVWVSVLHCLPPLVGLVVLFYYNVFVSLIYLKMFNVIQP